MKVSNATKVGVVTFLAVVVFVFGLVWKSGTFLKAYSYKIYGEFETVNGLLVNSQVLYRGYRVGIVEKIQPATRGVGVTVLIKKGVVLPANAVMRVSFDGLVGEKYMDILPQEPTNEVLKPGSRIPGFSSKGLVDFVDVATHSVEDTREIIAEFRDLIKDPTMNAAIKNTVLRLDTVTHQMEQILASINSFTSSEEVVSLVRSLEQTATALQKMTDRIVNDEESVENFRASLESIRNITSHIEKVTGEMSSMMINDGTTRNVTEFITNATEAMKGFNTFVSQNQLEETVSMTNEAINETNKILKSVSKTELIPHGRLLRVDRDSRFYYEVGLDLKILDKYLTHFNISNRGGADKLYNLQQGVNLTPSLVGRVGLVRSMPGFGFDYDLSQSLLLSADMHFDDDFGMDMTVSYSLFDRVYVMLGAEDVLEEKDSSLVFGIGLQ